jgi:hypothetical protein
MEPNNQISQISVISPNSINKMFPSLSIALNVSWCCRRCLNRTKDVCECSENEFVKLLAKMSGGDLSSTILRIYQTLAVEFQTARAEQIYITNRRYVTNTPPLPPSSLLHPIPSIVHHHHHHHPPPPSLPSLDPRET